MNRFECVLFDLDGTLIDTTPLILESFKHTFLFHFNEKKEDKEILSFLGLPLRKSFEVLYPGMEEILAKTYREFNESKHDQYVGIFINIINMLDGLKKRGITMGVVTSKRRELAMRGMQLFEIEKYMSVFIGLEDTTIHKPNGEPVLKALEQLGDIDMNKVLYVGDSPYDILCARNAGVKSAAVGWSYLTKDELRKSEPHILIESPEDLIKYI